MLEFAGNFRMIVGGLLEAGNNQCFQELFLRTPAGSSTRE